MSASPVLNKTLEQASEDNEIFLHNTKCTNITCIYALKSNDVINNAPWNTYPYWEMADLSNLPTKGIFDGALAIVDGRLLSLNLYYII